LTTNGGEPIGRVAVLSTGTVDIHPEHAKAAGTPMVWWILTSNNWLTGRPVNVYVIEHRDGLVLFDTGQDRASVTDPDYYPPFPLRIGYKRLARFHLGEHDTLPERMQALGYSPGDVRKVVLSHLHQDHIGGLAFLQDAEIVVSAEEWKTLTKPLPESRGVLRKKIDLPGLRWNHFDFAPTNDPDAAPFTESYDLMGDGSLVLLRTPGHTPGSISMLVKREPNPLLLVGDLTFSCHIMEDGHVPGVGHKKQLRDSTDKVLTMKRRRPGLAVLAAHDPDAAGQLQQAT
jgi:glyoxylase-like metal-dependent hydrolase (beta-lactamase superfamily II)